MSTPLTIPIELLRAIYRQQSERAAAGVARAIARPEAREEFLRQTRENRPPTASATNTNLPNKKQ